MGDAIRVVAPCGCEYEMLPCGVWSVTAPDPCVTPPHSGLIVHGVLRNEYAGAVAAGYAIAASTGRGPWAKHWPGKP